MTFEAGGFNAFSDKGISTYAGMQKDGSIIYIGSVADKLAEYEDLEEQGKLLKLFCVRGDTVWFIKSAFSFSAFPIEAKVVFVNGVDFYNDVIYSASVKDSGIDRRFKNSDIGKTVFLTIEAAEAALKELERGKGE